MLNNIKKILILPILPILLIFLPLLSSGQLAFKKEPIIQNINTNINLHLSNLKDDKTIVSRGINNGIGPIMMVGGAAFILGGTLTKPDRTLKNGVWQNKTFINQGPRAWATITGIGMFCGGIVYTINN
jgi:hypothetical protein